MSAEQRDNALMQFVSITDADPATALKYLEGTGWNVEVAVSQYLEGAPASSQASSSRGFPSSGAAGVSSSYDDFHQEGVRAAQEAVFDQMDGPMGSGGQGHRGGAVHAFRNFEAERMSSTIPFSSGGGARGGPVKNMASIMRPPTELIFPGTYEQARNAAKASKKWLLVNIQYSGDFDSWKLNRDVWKDETVEEIIRSSFVFWQQDIEHESIVPGMQTRAGEVNSIKVVNAAAQHFIDRHHLPYQFPVIALVDPRTGELVFTHTGFWPRDRAVEHLVDWPTRHALDDFRPIARSDTRVPGYVSSYPTSGGGGGSAGPSAFPRPDNTSSGPATALNTASTAGATAIGIDMEEEEMLRRAIAESMVGSATTTGTGAAVGGGTRGSSNSVDLVFDSDSEDGVEVVGSSVAASKAHTAPHTRTDTGTTSISSGGNEAITIASDDDDDDLVEGGSGAQASNAASGGASRSGSKRPRSPSAATTLAASAQAAGSKKGAPAARMEDTVVDTPTTPESLPPEPEGGSTARIQLRLPDGRRAQRKFLASDPLSAAYHWASTLLALPHPIATAHQRAMAGVTAEGGSSSSSSSTVSSAAIAGASLSGFPLSALVAPGAAFVCQWDLMRPHPAKSLASEAAGGATFGEAALLSAQLIVQMTR